MLAQAMSADLALRHAVVTLSLCCNVAVSLCGWHHFQFIMARFVWEGPQIKVPNVVVFPPSSPPSIPLISFSTFTQQRVVASMTLCLNL